VRCSLGGFEGAALAVGEAMPLCDQVLGPVQFGLPFALGWYLLKYSQLAVELLSTQLLEPSALEAGAEIEAGIW
jgi:hypothetical protein